MAFYGDHWTCLTDIPLGMLYSPLRELPLPNNAEEIGNKIFHQTPARAKQSWVIPRQIAQKMTFLTPTLFDFDNILHKCCTQ